MSMIKELIDVSKTDEEIPDIEETDCEDLSDMLKELDDEFSSFEDLRYDEQP